MAKKNEYELDIRISGTLDRSLADAIKKSQREIDNFSSKFNRAAPFFNGLQSMAGNAIRTVTNVVKTAVPVMKDGLMAVSEIGMGFEKQMSAVRAITQGTRNDMELIQSRARELGRNTVYTAEEIGQAMESMALSGWSANEIYSGISGVIDLAAASGEELNLVSGIMTDTLHAFSMGAGEANKAANVLAATALNSNTNIEGLGEAMKYVGPVAGSLGMDIESVSTALGLLADQGLKATQGGTALRTVLAKMMSGMSVGGNAINVTDEAGNMRNFLDIIRDIRNEFNKLPAAQKGAEAFSVGGLRGSTALLALANASEEKLNSLYATVLNSSAVDTVGTAARTRLNNLAGDIELAKDALKDLGLTVYDDVGSPLRTVVQWATQLVNTLNKKVASGSFFDWMKQLASNKNVAQATTLVRRVFEMLKGLKGPALDTLQFLGRNLNKIAGGFAAVGTAIATYRTAEGLINVASAIAAFATNKVTLVITAISAAVGIFASIQFRNAMQNMAEAERILGEGFGDIVLSTTEISRAVDILVGPDRIAKLDAFANSLKLTSDALESMSASGQKLDSYNWMIELGVKLGDSDVGDYKESIESFVEQANTYIRNNRISVKIAAELLFDTDIGMKERLAFSTAGIQIEQLGKEMSDVFNRAFVDGVFRADLLDTEKIARLQMQIAEITNHMAGAEMTAKFEQLKRKGGAALDADTFSALMAEYSSVTEEAMGQYNEARQKLYEAAAFTYADEAERQAAYDKADEGYRKKVTEMYAKEWQFIQETLAGTGLGDLAGQGIQTMQANIANVLTAAFDGVDIEKVISDSDYANRIGTKLDEALAANAGLLSGGEKKALEKMAELMKPTWDAFENLKAEYEAKSLEVPAAITEALNSRDSYMALIEGGDALAGLVYNAIVDNDNYATLFKAAYDTGGQIDQRLTLGVTENASAAAMEAASAAREQYELALNNAFEKPIEVETKVKYVVTTDDGYADQRAKADAGRKLVEQHFSRSSLPTLPGFASGGFVTSPTLSMVGEAGAEAIIPMDGTQRAFSLWNMAGEILSRKSRAGNLGSGTGNGSIVYSPTITINGNASREDVLSATRQAQREFDEHMERWLRSSRRVSFSY